HTRSKRDWSSDVCSSDLVVGGLVVPGIRQFLRQILLGDDTAWIIVWKFISDCTSQTLCTFIMSIAQMRRHMPNLAAGDIFLCRCNSLHHRVGFRCSS